MEQSGAGIEQFLPLLLVELILIAVFFPMLRRKVAHRRYIWVMMLLVPGVNYCAIAYLAAKTDTKVLGRIAGLESAVAKLTGQDVLPPQTALIVKGERGMGRVGKLFEGVFGGAFAVFLFVACFGAWAQHLYTCFTENRWGILIAGAIFFPVGIVHGWGIWFGFWH